MRKAIAVILAVGFVACGVLHAGLQPAGRAQAPKKAVMIIANKDFQDDEFQQPKQVLEDRGVQVTVAGVSLDQATGMNGLTVQPQMTMKDVNPADFDAVIFVGGSGATVYLNDPVAHRLAFDALSQGKTVGAICIAPVCLARAGLLKGKRVTTYPVEANKKELEGVGATYTAADVEIDGNLITGSGPAAARQFGEALAKALGC